MGQTANSQQPASPARTPPQGPPEAGAGVEQPGVEAGVEAGVAAGRGVWQGEALEALLTRRRGARGGLEDLVVVDLALGALEPHTAAKECCRQLQLPFQEISVDCGKGMSALNIDRQGYGHLGRLTAYANAAAVAAALRARTAWQVLVTLPASEGLWEEEDRWFLDEVHRLLGHAGWLILAAVTSEAWLPSRRCIRFAAGPHAPEHPDAPALSYLPGLVPPGVPGIFEAFGRLQEANKLWALPDGRCLSTVARTHAPALLAERLSAPAIRRIVLEAPWFRFYVPAHVKRISVTPAECFRLAASAFRLGVDSHELRMARWITERAWRPSRKAKLQLVLMFIYLNTRQHALLCDLEADDQHHTEDDLRALWDRKGYGHVFSERPLEALACFDRADAIPSNDPEDGELRALFRLNIKSLALLKTGDGSGALGLQKELERRAGACGRNAFHIACINALNLGRLHLRLGAPAEALPYIRRFMAMNRGTASDSYLLAGHLYLARAHAAEGDARSALEEALKIALLWLSLDSLGALSKRTYKRFVASDPLPDAEIIEAISNKLAADLAARASASGYVLEDGEDAAPDFVRSDHRLDADSVPPAHVVLGTAAWAVLASRTTTTKQRIHEGRAYRDLCRLAWRIMRQEVDVAHADAIKTIIVDTDQGYGLAAGPGLPSWLLRFGVAAIYQGKTRIDLDAQSQATIEDRIRVKVSDGVEEIRPDAGGAELRFRRFRPPEHAMASDALWMQALAEAGDRGLAMKALGADRAAVLRLYARGWVHLFYATPPGGDAPGASDDHA